MRNYQLNLSEIFSQKAVFDFFFDSAYQAIEQLGQDYPDFNAWYYNKIKAGVGTGEREVILSIIDDYIAGLAVLKKTSMEKKICTIRVLGPFQKNGIGQSLIVKSFAYLDTEKPLITINSNKHNQFNRIFKHFGFIKYSELNDYYLKNQKEISYNGYL